MIVMSKFVWHKPESLYTVVCRPALPKDTPDVLELTRDIWDGGDYVPHVWQDWLADPVGRLAAAEYGGRVVGVSNLTRLAPGQWWMAGLRVHPAYQGRGIARRLHDYLVATWETDYGGALRLATSSKREPVHHMCETTGFRRVQEYSKFHAGADKGTVGSAERFRLLAVDEIPKALARIAHSEILQRMGGLMDLGWSYAVPDAFLLERAVREQRAWAWRDGAGYLVVWDDDEPDEGGTVSFIGLPACELDELGSYLQDCRALNARRGFDVTGWVAPFEPELLEILDRNGFEREWEGTLYVFERREAA